MKKMFFIGVMTFLVLPFTNVKAQQKITIQNGNTISFYSSLDSAIFHAQNGDTIYLPGGSFTFGSPLSKRLFICGVGHNPDSTAVTDQTYVTDDQIFLTTGADGGLLSGVYIQGVILFGTSQSNANVNNFTVSRCNIRAIQFLYSTPANNIFNENIIRGFIDILSSKSNGFYNNIIETTVFNLGSNNTFRNNIFLTTAWIGGSVLNSTFDNNIFVASNNSMAVFNYDIFNNNLFVENLQFPNGTNIGSNNISAQPQSSIFVNQSGNSFSYSQNYHLKPSSPGVNTGTDGKDIGIYGGLFPWKDGSLPNNPHIQFKNISTSTDQNGNLQINIKVKAQDN